jgi:hypothetical protein
MFPFAANCRHVKIVLNFYFFGFGVLKWAIHERGRKKMGGPQPRVGALICVRMHARRQRVLRAFARAGLEMPPPTCRAHTALQVTVT